MFFFEFILTGVGIIGRDRRPQRAENGRKCQRTNDGTENV